MRGCAAAAGLVLLLGGCGGTDAQIPGGGDELTVTSPDLSDGGQVPARFTCDGADGPPRLTWSDAPSEAVEVVIVVDDPDAPEGVFVHWTVWGLPARESTVGAQLPSGAVEGTNDFGEVGYRGPCPPAENGPHGYRFRVLALDEPVDLPAGASPEELASEVDGRVRASGVLTATYGR